MRQVDPDLSAYLHDGESEKAFTLSALEGQLLPSGKQLKLVANQIYHWHISGLSQRVALFLKQWLTNLPTVIDLRGASLQIKQVSIAHAPTTYAQLLRSPVEKSVVDLSFVSPTSFRSKGQPLRGIQNSKFKNRVLSNSTHKYRGLILNLHFNFQFKIQITQNFKIEKLFN